MVLTSVALIPVVLGVLGLIAAFGIYRIVLKYPEGTGKVAAIAEFGRGARKPDESTQRKGMMRW